jgi:hypothetical protein
VIPLAAHCPHCGAEQPGWAEELARIERSIAELKARDVAIDAEREDIAARIQQAVLRRDLLAHSAEEKTRQATRQKRPRRAAPRRPPAGAPPGATPRAATQPQTPGGPPPRVPRQGRTRVAPPPADPPTGGRADGHRPEASTREVQNVLLGLGALLLGVAAVVFALVAISSLGAGSRVLILAAATALMLAGGPVLARRGLTATAETVAAVGLLLVPLTGYAVWALDAVSGSGLSGAVFAGLVLLVTAGLAGVYGTATGLTVPRYAMVLAVQPVLPLFAVDRVTGPAGWALVLSTVAAADLALCRSFLAPPFAPRVPAADPARSPARPESAGEEADAVLTGDDARPEPAGPEWDGPVDLPTAMPWLRAFTWGLHALAALAALAYATVAVVRAGTVPDAVRAGAVLVLAAGVALVGALALRRPAPRDLAAGVFTLAVVAAVGRVASVALPGRALLVTAAVIVLAGLAVRLVSERARRGPQFASALALVVIGVVVAGDALRAALAPVRAAQPTWAADLAGYPGRVAAGVGSTGWQLATATGLLTVAAVVALPVGVRREFAVTGAALTASAVPASYGLSWSAAPWVPVLAAVGIGVAGLTADTARAGRAHALGAAAVGAVGAGMSVARPGLTAAVLFALAVAGALVCLAPRAPGLPLGASAPMVADWAAGGAALALPGAVAAFVAATVHSGPGATGEAVPRASLTVLAASFLAVCATVGYAAVTQVARRQISAPLAMGTGFGALAVAAASFAAPGSTWADKVVGLLLAGSATLLLLTPRIDAGRRSDRVLDGPDLAAAAAAAGLVAALARIAAVLTPGAELAAAAGLVLLVAAGVRAMPADWRRGPVVGLVVAGAVVALAAGATAVGGAVRVLATPGRLWAGDLTDWPAGTSGGPAWQAPVALLLLAGAAAIALPRPQAYAVAGACAGLAAVGTPAALGLPWWSPILVGGVVATGFALGAVSAADPRAAVARTWVAAAVALHAVGASLVRPWTTAAALGVVVLLGTAVAGLARTVAPLAPDAPDRADAVPVHLARIGGTATAAALFALPGALAALAAQLGWSAAVVLTGALAGSSLGVAVVAVARRRVPAYLPYATVGVVAGATAVAVASLFTDLPSGVYAAAAALLGVLAELLRAATAPPVPLGARTGRFSARGLAGRWLPADRPTGRWWSPGVSAARRWSTGGSGRRWSVNPAAGAMAAAVLPTAVALFTLAPALLAALVQPYRVLLGVWDGPPPELVTPPPDAVDATNVLAALLLTVAAALAATGFAGGRPARAVPVVLPGVAVTVLIAPISLGMGWPRSTMGALAVFTLAMLGLALTPPPPPAERARSLRVTRALVFGIGLAAGGAGLAGALATRSLTLFTLGSAVGVGAVAAVAGRTQRARILGWLFAAVMAQLFVLTVGLVAGLAPVWSAFGVLAVGAVLLVASATLPRLRQPEAVREAAAVEWSGYGAALIALALAFQSPRHVAALLAAWGAVIGVAASRPGRGPVERRVLFWAAVACEITAWWLLMWISDVALPEAYTLPFAALALLVGLLELRHRPDLSSWYAYGPALLAAFVPTLVIVLTTDSGTLRQVLLLLGAVAVLIFGTTSRQQAPVVIGAVVTAVTALHALTVSSPWLVLLVVGIVLLVLGASNERRRRTQDRLRGALRGMR